MNIEEINSEIKKLEESGIDVDLISDNYHTFGELYLHRMILFASILNDNKDISFKSKKHDDGTMYSDYFICGIKTKKGYYTYHYNLKYWDFFNINELPKAPAWDGHKPSDIYRLLYIR